MTSIFVFVVLVSFADWRTDQKRESGQEKFEKNYQSIVNENRKPSFPSPAILDWSSEDPYVPSSLFVAKIIPYGWLSGSPIADQALRNLQLASTVSESFLSGDLVLTEGFLSKTIEAYLLDVYGICGKFELVESQIFQTFVFRQGDCPRIEDPFSLVGQFSYDESDLWSLSPDFSFILNSCLSQDFLKTVTFGLFSPFGQYAVDRLVAIEYVDEFGVEKSENFSVKAFQNNRFTIRTLGCRIGVVSLSEPVIPFQVNPEYQDQRTLYLGISNPSLLTGYKHIFKQ